MNTEPRMLALYKITDPLWQAIALGKSLDVDRLQHQLRMLIIKDRENYGRRPTPKA